MNSGRAGGRWPLVLLCSTFGSGDRVIGIFLDLAKTFDIITQTKSPLIKKMQWVEILFGSDWELLSDPNRLSLAILDDRIVLQVSYLHK